SWTNTPIRRRCNPLPCKQGRPESRVSADLRHKPTRSRAASAGITTHRHPLSIGESQHFQEFDDMSSKNKVIQALEAEQMSKQVPDFAPGDTIVVQVKVKEGNRERLQAFEGVVIGKRNRGLNSAFTVRKISHGVGVERTFQTYSPLVDSISVKRRGDVRQAKLYYLRERSGKSARIKEKLA